MLLRIEKGENKLRQNEHEIEETLFEEGSVGALMTDEYISISEHATVDEAIKELRTKVRGKASIHYLFVVDNEGRLAGALSLRELLGAEGTLEINDIMKVKIIHLDINTDQEYAAKIFQDTDLVTVPVIDSNGHMLGVVHVDTMMDVMEQEATEDIHKMASISIDEDEQIEGGLLKAPLMWLYAKRIPWLIILVFVNLLSGAGIASYEDLIGAHVQLVFFLPLLIASGGNTGSQSTTLVIRSMAVGDVRPRDWFRVISKEVIVSLLLGLTMAVAIAGIAYYRGYDPNGGAVQEVAFALSLTVGLSMTVVVLFGGALGAILPFIFRFMKLDPATASTPLVTSICDIAGVFIYFGIANLLLGSILNPDSVASLFSTLSAWIA